MTSHCTSSVSCTDINIPLFVGVLHVHYPAINWRHQHSSNKPKADWGPCHRRNKWGKSLSQPMFLSPLTRLHDCAWGTFMDCLIQCWQIKTKSSQTGLKLSLWRVSQHIVHQKTNILLTIKHCFILFSPSDSICFPQHFFPEYLLPACENGVCIDELGPILISHHSWCGHFLVYYTTVAAYSPSSRKVDIWTTWPWQYGDNEISLMTLPERFYRLDYRLPTHVQ